MRILIIRTSAMGDVVHSLPTLRALRRHFPRATIGWVIERPFAPLLATDPDLDVILEVRLRVWRKSLASRATRRDLAQAVRALRAFGADVVLDLMGNHKAGAIAAFSGCGRRIGLRRRDRREPSSAVWINEPVRAIGTHSVERALSMAAALGADVESPDFGAEKLRLAGRTSSDYESGGPAPPYAVIHPGTARPDKCYPASLWGTVAKLLAANTGLRILISIGPGEEHLGEQVLEASRGAGGTARLAAEPSLSSLVALLGGADLVLAGDTGPMHLAHALGTPVLALMGPTEPDVHGPYGAPDRVLRTAPSPASWTEIEPQRVVDKAMDLLAPRERDSALAPEM
ncbi:MAG: lipopolysaccharide heptosyltransferase I [Acidobacteria bacterium]|nr:lipopolysaccharide heptosyltransferase I [Acidobacteriota bacterium]